MKLHVFTSAVHLAQRLCRHRFLAASSSSRLSATRMRSLLVAVVGLFASAPTTWSQGKVIAWSGWAQNGQANTPPNLTNAVAVSAGHTHSLVLLADGKVVAWGDNTYGKATVSQGLSSVVAIAAGNWHSMALTADGEVVVWGQSEFGQTTLPPGLSNVVAIAAGGHHCLALRWDGKVFAWGYNQYGQATVPTNLSSVVAVSAGYEHSLALKSDGTVVSWGSMKQPTVPEGLRDVVSIAAGNGFSLASKAEGTVVSWVEPYYIPTWAVNVIEVAAGGHGLALRGDGTIVGSDWSPFTVPLSNLVTIAAGQIHSMAVAGDGPPVAPTPIGPFSIRAQTGGIAVLQVSTKGPRPASYQWRKGGIDLWAQTNSTLAISNVQFTDQGSFSVALRGSFGMATSRVATLEVVDFGSPDIRADGEKLLGNVVRGDQSTISMSTAFANGSVFYTTDGSEPSFASKRYQAPFLLTKTATLRAVAYNLDFTQSVEGAPYQVEIIPTFEVKIVRGAGAIQTTLASTHFFPQSSVELIAYPAVNYRLVRWEGDACGASTNATMVMDGNKTAIAVFELIPSYILTTSVDGGEQVGTIIGNGTYYFENTRVSLKAQAAPGWQFMNWRGDAEGNSSNLVVTMDRNKTVRAVFGTTLNTAVGGSGTVKAYPTQGSYPYGSTVRLAAHPAPGYYFATWGGDGSSRANPLDFIVTNETPAVSALFAPLQGNAVNVYAEVEGQGTVAVSPDLPFYSPGASVTLNAAPATGWRFVQWQGAASGVSSNATVVLDASKTVTAVFQPSPRYTLSATTQGGGTIVGNREDTYPEGALVTLTAQPTNGWSFLGWQGDASGTAPSVTLTMERAKSVQAVFGTLLTFNVIGPGSLDGIPGAHPFGATVQLTATPNPGASFEYWGNDASGSENPLNYVVTKPKAAICVLFRSVQTTTPPAITMQPVPQSVVEGFHTTLRVAATGLAPLQYQWRKDGIPITGGTASSYTIFGAKPSDDGAYDVVVSNSGGSTTSVVARVTVILGPSLTIELNTYAEVTINGVAGFTYGIQHTTDLRENNSWSNATNLTLDLPRQTWIDLGSATNARRFYRVIER